jgi:hypothetical protein
MGEPDQGVEPPHVGLGAVGVVVREGRPQLDGAQRQPGGVQGPAPVHAEAHPDQPDESHQRLTPIMPVVPDPGPILEVGDAGRVERPEPAGQPGRPTDVTSVPSPGLPLADAVLACRPCPVVVLTEPCGGSSPASGDRLDAHSPLPL